MERHARISPDRRRENQYTALILSAAGADGPAYGTLRCRACDRGAEHFLRRRNVRARRQRDSILDRGNLGQNRYRIFRRCTAADVQAYGAVKTSDLFRRHVELPEPLTPM